MPEHARTPLGPMIVVIAAVLLGLAVFWVGFMLAPAIVLLIGYLALSAGDRARRQRSAPSGAAVAFAATAAASAQPAEQQHEILADARDTGPVAGAGTGAAHTARDRSAGAGTILGSGRRFGPAAARRPVAATSELASEHDSASDAQPQAQVPA
jgi:hypothetical protein